MSEINAIKARIKTKNDNSTNWKNSSLIPMKGEIIIYNDTIIPRIKIGDGVTLADNLPFSNELNFVYLITISLDQNNNYISNKSYEDIVELINNKVDVRCFYKNKYFNFMLINDSYIDFSFFTLSNTILNYEQFLFYSNGDIQLNQNFYDLSDIILNSQNYTDTAIANLINSAPETLDTLGELAIALQENKNVVDILNEAIATRVKTVNGVGVDSQGNVEVRPVPEVTEADNGKFLIVVNGKWTAESIVNAEGVDF